MNRSVVLWTLWTLFAIAMMFEPLVRRILNAEMIPAGFP